MKQNTLKPPRIINGIRDLTEKDIAMMRYRELQAAQAARNIIAKPKPTLLERLMGVK